MRTQYEAFIQRDFTSYHGLCRLFLIELGNYGNKSRFLMSDGTWQEVEEGVEVPGAGLAVPIFAVDAIHEAIKLFKGDALDSSTESKVLREWLEVERGRVDKMIGGQS